MVNGNLPILTVAKLTCPINHIRESGVKPTQQQQENYIFIHTPSKSLARSNPMVGVAAPFIDFLRFSLSSLPCSLHTALPSGR